MRRPDSLTVSAVAVWIWCFAASGPVAGQPTALVTIARGDVTSNGQPVGDGTAIEFDATIQTGPTAFATVRVEWPLGGERCFIESMFGFGQSFTVRRPDPTAQCNQYAVTKYAGRSVKAGSAGIGKGDHPAEAATAIAYAEFDHLKTALAGGMVLRDNENRRAADYNLPGTRAASAAECAAICARDVRCNAMTFIPDQQACWLKAEPGEPMAAPGLVSAVKRVNPKAVVPQP